MASTRRIVSMVTSAAVLVSRMIPPDTTSAVSRPQLLGSTGHAVYPITDTGGRSRLANVCLRRAREHARSPKVLLARTALCTISPLVCSRPA